jgi:hypothetical protein
MTLRGLVLGAGVLGAMVLGPPARAAGPPLPSSASGKAGVVAPGGSERLLARRAGRDTLVLAVRGRTVLRSRHTAGRWSVAPVTFDGEGTGLSADGRTLVLVRPTRAYPPTRTQLAVLDARQLVVRRRIALDGFFTVDAIAPNGRWLYLIQYAGDDVFDYRVRALDLRTGELAARDIVDPRAPDERMGGLPFTRVIGRDGRWVYTLYGGGAETFIHALDTVGRTAACIDVEGLAPDADLSAVRLRLSEDERQIEVRHRGGLVASLDARPRLPVARKAAIVRAKDERLPWLLVMAGVVVAVVLVAAAGHAVRPASRAG